MAGSGDGREPAVWGAEITFLTSVVAELNDDSNHLFERLEELCAQIASTIIVVQRWLNGLTANEVKPVVNRLTPEVSRLAGQLEHAKQIAENKKNELASLEGSLAAVKRKLNVASDGPEPVVLVAKFRRLVAQYKSVVDEVHSCHQELLAQYHGCQELCEVAQRVKQSDNARTKQRQQRGERVRITAIWLPLALLFAVAAAGLMGFALLLLFKAYPLVASTVMFFAFGFGGLLVSDRINATYGFRTVFTVERFTGIRIGGAKVTEESAEIGFGCVLNGLFVCLGLILAIGVMSVLTAFK